MRVKNALISVVMFGVSVASGFAYGATQAANNEGQSSANQIALDNSNQNVTDNSNQNATDKNTGAVAKKPVHKHHHKHHHKKHHRAHKGCHTHHKHHHKHHRHHHHKKGCATHKHHHHKKHHAASTEKVSVGNTTVGTPADPNYSYNRTKDYMVDHNNKND